MNKAQSLNKLYKECERNIAALYAPGDTLLVFGAGDPDACIVLVGEAPGKDEVLRREPFVGKAGRNLDAFLISAGLKREELYITNAVKLRPMRLSEAGRMVNRPPTAEEITLFKPCLHGEIAIIKPRLIVTLGNVALRAVTGERLTIGDVHGQERMSASGAVFPLYHPASVIYNQSLKETYANDLKALGVFARKMGG